MAQLLGRTWPSAEVPSQPAAMSAMTSDLAAARRSVGKEPASLPRRTVAKLKKNALTKMHASPPARPIKHFHMSECHEDRRRAEH